MEWLRVGLAAALFAVLFAYLWRRAARPGTPAPVTWRMEMGKGGRLWWTSSTGVQVCGLCYDSYVVVDHIAGYRTSPCPQCSRPDGKVRPMGVAQ